MSMEHHALTQRLQQHPLQPSNIHSPRYCTINWQEVFGVAQGHPKARQGHRGTLVLQTSSLYPV